MWGEEDSRGSSDVLLRIEEDNLARLAEEEAKRQKEFYSAACLYLAQNPFFEDNKESSQQSESLLNLINSLVELGSVELFNSLSVLFAISTVISGSVFFVDRGIHYLKNNNPISDLIHCSQNAAENVMHLSEYLTESAKLKLFPPKEEDVFRQGRQLADVSCNSAIYALFDVTQKDLLRSSSYGWANEEGKPVLSTRFLGRTFKDKDRVVTWRFRRSDISLAVGSIEGEQDCFLVTIDPVVGANRDAFRQTQGVTPMAPGAVVALVSFDKDTQQRTVTLLVPGNDYNPVDKAQGNLVPMKVTRESFQKAHAAITDQLATYWAKVPKTAVSKTLSTRDDLGL